MTIEKPTPRIKLDKLDTIGHFNDIIVSIISQPYWEPKLPKLPTKKWDIPVRMLQDAVMETVNTLVIPYTAVIFIYDTNYKVTICLKTSQHVFTGLSPEKIQGDVSTWWKKTEKSLPPEKPTTSNVKSKSFKRHDKQ